MRIKDTLINIAIKAVQDKVLDKDTSEVPSEFNGYISSFGASMISSGLLPTIIFFSQEKESKGNRTSVVKAIEFILNTANPELLKVSGEGKEYPTLAKKILHCINQNHNMHRLEEAVQEAAVALKLAIRIFPKAKKN